MRGGAISTARHILLIAAAVAAAVLVASARSDETSGPAPSATPFDGVPSAGGGGLSITIDGLRQTRGTVLVGLYDSKGSFERAIRLASEEGFLNDPDRVAGAALRANDRKRAAVSFKNLTPGRYAVILFHDENGNGKLDKNFWGVPTEPYGFSNNAEGTFGPPGFDDAALTLDGSDRAVAIELVYHGGGAIASAPRDDDPPPFPAGRARPRSTALPAGDAAHF